MIIKEKGSYRGVDQIILTSNSFFSFATSRLLGCLQEFSVYLKPTRRPGDASREREGERRGRAYLNTGEMGISIGCPPVR